MKHGFIPVCKVPFNDEFAPDGWNFERDGRPFIIFLDIMEKALMKY